MPKFDDINVEVAKLKAESPPTHLEIKIKDITITNYRNKPNEWYTSVLDKDGKSISEIIKNKDDIRVALKSRDDDIIEALVDNTNLDKKDATKALKKAKFDLIDNPSTQLYMDSLQSNKLTDDSEVNVHEMMEMAREYDKVVHLLYDGKLFWIWNKNKYIEMDKQSNEIAIVSSAIKVLNDENLMSKNVHVEFIRALKIIGYDNYAKIYYPKLNWVHFKNVVYDIETKEEFEATPEYFFKRPIPHNLGKSDECPYINQLFNEWMNNINPDKQQEVKSNVKALYEILGYGMLDNYPIAKMFWLLGGGRNGKGSYLKMASMLFNGNRRSGKVVNMELGGERVVTTDMKRIIGNTFETHALHEKSLCVISEVGENVIKDTTMFKKLTGEDEIPGEEKYGRRYTFYNYAKVIIAANKLPDVADNTDAWYSRNFKIKFRNKYGEGNDILGLITEEEMEALCRRCLNALHDVLHNKSFTGEGTIEDKRISYDLNALPVNKFVESDCALVDKRDYMPVCYFRRKFDEYALENDVMEQSIRSIGMSLNMMIKSHLINGKITNTRVTTEDIDRFKLKTFTKEELESKEGYENIQPGHDVRCVFGVLTNNIIPKTYNKDGEGFISSNTGSTYPDGQYATETKTDKPLTVGAINC